MSNHDVAEILKNPPDWLKQSYLAGYLAGAVRQPREGGGVGMRRDRRQPTRRELEAI
jgi:hypothetical protein